MNKKEIQNSNDPDTKAKDWILNLTIEKAMENKKEDWQKLLKGSSLRRIKPWMWQRNVNYILKNKKLSTFKNKSNEK